MKQKQKKQAEKEALDPDANYTEDKGDFEIPVEDEPEENRTRRITRRHLILRRRLPPYILQSRNRLEGFLSQN